jgi:hypothetical protein
MESLASMPYRALMLDSGADAQFVAIAIAVGAIKLQLFMARSIVCTICKPQGEPTSWYLRAIEIEQRKLTTMLGVKDPAFDWAAKM